MFRSEPLQLVVIRQERAKKNAKAERAAAEARPKTYRLVRGDRDKENADMRMLVIGCQGNAKTEQMNVAELMNAVAGYRETHKPDFILMLGDSFYDSGVECADDVMFNSHFHDIYANPTLEALKDIPCFAFLGNHDHNFHKMRIPGAECGVPRAMHQVAHTYLPRQRFRSTEELQQFYRSHTDEEVVDIDITKLPKWNMPSRAYAIICGNTQLFCIDSNTYIADYLAALRGDTNPANQVNWLVATVKIAKAAGRTVALALHHPLFTPGKRAFHNDISLYLSEDEIKSEAFQRQFGALNSSACSYNSLLRETFKQQALVFDSVYAAHDHNLYYYNNKSTLTDYPLCQITSGGGGGSLQDREEFAEQDKMAFFLKRNGFVDVFSRGDRKLFSYLIHSIPTQKCSLRLLMHYDSNDTTPYYHFPKVLSVHERTAIQLFISTVNAAIKDYLVDFIAPRQRRESGGFLGITPWKGNVTHGQEGVERAHLVWNYIRSMGIKSLADVIATVRDLSKWESTLTTPTSHSFITLLNNRIKEIYGEGFSIENLSDHLVEKQPEELAKLLHM